MRSWLRQHARRLFVPAAGSLALLFGTVLSASPALAYNGGTASSYASNAPSADELAVERVCTQAMVAMQTLPVRMGTPGSSVVTAQSAQSTDISPVTDAQRQQMKDHAATTLATLYSGNALAKKVGEMQAIIDHYTTGDVRYFGSGLDWIHFNNVTINGNTASVTAQVQVWAKKAQDQGHGKLVYATPRSQLIETWTLTKVNNRWLITSESWQFAPGWEP